jgi:hypothetical protein
MYPITVATLLDETKEEINMDMEDNANPHSFKVLEKVNIFLISLYIMYYLK